MGAEGFSRYAELRQSSRVYRDGFMRRSRTVVQMIGQALDARTDSAEAPRLLDVGTADGIMLSVFREAFPAVTLRGIEASEELAHVARGHGFHVDAAMAESLPHPDASFDVVTLVATLKHIPDAHAALVEAHRVLVPGGHVIVADPTPFGLRLGLWRGHFDERYLPNRWSLSTTRARLAASGFEVVRATRYMPAPIDLRVARWMERPLRGMGLSRLFMQQASLARRLEA